MDRAELYDKLAERKSKPKDFQPYQRDNGRVNKAVELFWQKKLRTGGTLLDVGGGIGDLGYAVRDLFDRRITVDISTKNLAAAAAKGNEAWCRDVDKEGLGDDEYGIDGRPTSGRFADVVTALDFIEHIVDPENFARECFRVLNPGGHVFINTPNIRFWRHIEQLVWVGRFPHTSGDKEVYHGGHLAFFTRRDLEEIFGGAGFINFEQFKDEECYEQVPPSFFQWAGISVKNQEDYKLWCMEYCNPSLLFKAVKPE
jgi:2-polyprenyl-3-methyl-5-hydroxy-6-metoxy-1,4-benzoquinol methylase